LFVILNIGHMTHSQVSMESKHSQNQNRCFLR